MPKLDSNLSYPIETPPQAAELISIAPGVEWLRMPLPFALDHINLWLVDDGDGDMLVDTGFDTQETRSIWMRIAERRFKEKTPTRLFCTHHHPDHMGLSGWLTKQFEIPLLVSEGEWDAFFQWSRPSDDDFAAMMRRYYRWSGVADDRAARDLKHRNNLRLPDRVDPSAHDTVKAGDTVSTAAGSWRLLCGRGHAPELLAPYNEEHNVLIAGDQVLPGISPNIGVYPFEVLANPLQLYFDSLAEFRTLPEDTLVLPSHKLPFRGLHTRIDTLISHHDKRLEEAVSACQDPVTAASVAAVLFPRATGDQQFFFALGETLAHLNYLVAQGALGREVDSDDQALFHAC